MEFAAALSEHPLATQAVGEMVGQVLERLGAQPDLAVLFVTAPHAGALEDISRAVRRLLNPRVLIGATAVSVLGGSQEVEEAPAMSLFAARFGIDIDPVRLEAISTADQYLVAGGGVLQRNEGTLLLLVDPFTFPADQVLEHLAQVAPGVAIIGGMASAARGPGGNVLIADDELFRDGAVGVYLPPEIVVSPVVSQGCRPIGQPLIVTRSEHNIIYEIAGQPAINRLNEQIERLDPLDRQMLAAGIHIGRVIDERRDHFEQGDFLIRGVIGTDRTNGALAVSAEIESGATVQFQVRDAASADSDLRAMLEGRTARGALVFTCNGRGVRLFGEPGHDSSVVSETTGAAVAGMFCTGELGPVGGRNFVHGFTASIALFGEST